MAYARAANNQTVIVVLNNDTKPSGIKFDVSMLKSIGSNNTLTDRLGAIPDVKIENGTVNFSMPARTAAIFTVK